MSALLDTHAFLWAVTDPAQLSARAYDIISDGANTLFLSAASGWEIAIKTGLGKLHLPTPPERFVSEQLAIAGFESLPIQLLHALHVYTLPSRHRDPFDRLLVAQSQVEQLPIITADPRIAQYNVAVIW